MFSIEEFIIAVFCCVDDVLIEITQIYPIKRRGFAPSLRESEVLTMEVVAEFLGIDADKDIWKYFHLVERFHIEKIRARDMWHLTSRLNRKILAHTILSVSGLIATIVTLFSSTNLLHNIIGDGVKRHRQ